MYDDAISISAMKQTSIRNYTLPECLTNCKWFVIWRWQHSIAVGDAFVQTKRSRPDAKWFGLFAFAVSASHRFTSASTTTWSSEDKMHSHRCHRSLYEQSMNRLIALWKHLCFLQKMFCRAYENVGQVEMKLSKNDSIRVASVSQATTKYATATAKETNFRHCNANEKFQNEENEMILHRRDMANRDVKRNTREFIRRCYRFLGWSI